MAEQPIPSPFSGATVKEIHKATNSNEIVEAGLRGFTALLATSKENGEDTPPEILGAYIAGFIGCLKALGFQDKDTCALGMQIFDLIMEKGKGGCGECDACKSKEK